jgi:NADPH-dependent glutamate synthase beta subunit-like oxidoreductase/Pyruvate/2-oxoacid:ferredoxin oxidoreductase delta subunit
MTGEVLIVGSSQGGIQAAWDLAQVGVHVHLLDSKPFLGKKGEHQFPDYLTNQRLLEIIKHPNITTWTNAELGQLTAQDGGFRAEIDQYPRYIDLSKCTACGECVDVCPVVVPGTDRKAIIIGGQPGCAAIDKGGISPCTNACPAGIHVQGYVALIAQKRYREAYELIHQAMPFPSVCGRVCNHYCEQACTRKELDDPVNLMALKRYVSDWAYDHQEELVENHRKSFTPPPSSGKSVAVIGAGPAGLTAARDLVHNGHAVTVFDDHPVAGGMMRVGIPPHRLPYDQLDWEIKMIEDEGVNLQLNTWVDDVPGLLEDGFNAVLIASGAHQALKINIDGADHPDNWLSLDFLKRICLGEEIDLSGRKVIVLGGGDVAMDAARVAVRLGSSEVRIVCRGMRASFNEILEAEEEGVDIIRERVFQKIVLFEGKIAGVECLKADVGEIIDGKRQFKKLPGTEHLIPGDLVIWALGQRPDFSFLPSDEAISLRSTQGIEADQQMMTSLEGVFVAGDVRRGTTFFVVDAVGEGHQAAQAIDHYLKQETYSIKREILPEVILSKKEIISRVEGRESAQCDRVPTPHLPIEQRENNFKEVDLSFDEISALQEAGRCLVCGPCSECMACVEVCQPGAVIHDQTGSTTLLEVDALILAEDALPDLETFEPYRIPPADPLSGSAVAFQIMQALDVRPALPIQVNHQIAPVEPRSDAIGLILCQCGGEISRIVDTSLLKKEAITWPGITFAQELPFSCSKEAADQIREWIETHTLNKLLLAACACCPLDQICYSCTYQRYRCKHNLGVFSALDKNVALEFVNIREQCAWVHQENPNAATVAARRLIQSTLTRLTADQVERLYVPEKPKGVVILGHGETGEHCAASLSQLGITPALVEDLPESLTRMGGRFRIQGNEIHTQADIVVLVPADQREYKKLPHLLKMADGTPIFSAEGLPVNLLEYGILLCKADADPLISGKAAAARVGAWINRMSWQAAFTPVVVDKLRCRGCGTCVDVCGFGIPEIIEEEFGTTSLIDPRLCQGCGICIASCPSGAIRSGKVTELQLDEMLDAILT